MALSFMARKPFCLFVFLTFCIFLVVYHVYGILFSQLTPVDNILDVLSHNIFGTFQSKPSTKNQKCRTVGISKSAKSPFSPPSLTVCLKKAAEGERERERKGSFLSLLLCNETRCYDGLERPKEKEKEEME